MMQSIIVFMIPAAIVSATLEISSYVFINFTDVYLNNNVV